MTKSFYEIQQGKRWPDAWIQTFSGIAFWPLEPDLNLILVKDIAWALAHQCRYAGHTNRLYSVAEHSLHLASVCSPQHKLWALLHDASEAYLVDVPRPVKWALPQYAEIEENLMRAISARFGLEWPAPPEIKRLDSRILEDERLALMQSPPPLPWGIERGLGIERQIADFDLSPSEVAAEYKKAIAVEIRRMSKIIIYQSTC